MDRTYPRLGARLVELGMISPAKADEVVAVYGDEELDEYEVREALVEFGVAVSAHAGDVDDLGESYEAFLRAAARLAGREVGGFSLDGDDLAFTLDGVVVEWRFEHRSREYLDHLTLVERIGELDPDDERRFRSLTVDESGEDSFFLLATPDQAVALRDGFGVDYD